MAVPCTVTRGAGAVGARGVRWGAGYAASTSTISASSKASIVNVRPPASAAPSRVVDPLAVDHRARRSRAPDRRAAPRRPCASRVSPAVSVAASTRASARIGSASRILGEAARQHRPAGPTRSPLGNGLAPQLGSPPVRVGSIQIWNSVVGLGLEIELGMAHARCPRSSPARRPPRCGPCCPASPGA